MFWKKKKAEPVPMGRVPVAPSKLEHTVAHIIADELKIALSNLKIEIPPVTVDHKLPDNYTVDLNIPEVKVNVIGIPTTADKPPTTDTKKALDDDSIRLRKAQQAQRINEILRTKGEKIRGLKAYYWNAYLEADRKGQKDKAIKFKHKYEAIEEVIGEQGKA